MIVFVFIKVIKKKYGVNIYFLYWYFLFKEKLIIILNFYFVNLFFLLLNYVFNNIFVLVGDMNIFKICNFLSVLMKV